MISLVEKKIEVKYEVVSAGLKLAKMLEVKHLHAYSDSKLVVR